MNKPLITHIYTADPSAHVFEGKIYIYPSHDLDHNNIADDTGDQYDMEDIHVFSMDGANASPVDHGEVLHLKDIPWVKKQLWAPDAAEKNSTYYLYFGAKDKQDVFRIGAATSKSPAGPFKAQPEFIPGSFSVDPCVFMDDDGQNYLFFGGLWGGQLEKWKTGEFDPDGKGPEDYKPAIGPRMVKLAADMLNFNSPIKKISIIDEKGQQLTAGDHDRRFFEGSWVHKYQGTYYLSYSTGDTHRLVYATSQKIDGPYTYQGVILNPVLGWTTHHSIVEFQNKWYLFFHDASLSGGADNKRSIKMAELHYNPDGSINTVIPEE
jgi:beta-xylosidase